MDEVKIGEARLDPKVQEAATNYLWTKLKSVKRGLIQKFRKLHRLHSARTTWVLGDGCL